jgi:hypothetical protein
VTDGAAPDPTPRSGCPHPHQERDDRRLSGALRTATVVCLVLAALGAVLPGTWGRTVAGIAVTAVVAVPLLRVVWLVARWWREGDRRFVAAGCVLLGLVALGFVLALA